MLKLDFLNNDYSLDEVIDGYTDGNLDNFKGDKDFLDFLISYSLGNYLEGDEAESFKQAAQYGGLLNVMKLDEYGYFGKKIYKIYEICGKDKIKFMKVCDLIGQYTIKHTLEKETIDKNLELENPVDFIDDNIVLSSGAKPEYDPNKIFVFRFGLEDIDDELEFDYEVERSLRKRINDSIRANNENVDLLEELPSYVDKKKNEKEEQEKKRVKDDYEVDINNLYFGTQIYDASCGVLNFNMKSISWFEYMNIDILNFHIFRSIPIGDYCLLDNNGKIHIPEQVFKKNNISIGPNTPIRSVSIYNIPTIFDLAIKKLNEEPIVNEDIILKAKALLEIFERKGKLKVKELDNYYNMIRLLYDEFNKNPFEDDDNINYEVDNGNDKHK